MLANRKWIIAASAVLLLATALPTHAKVEIGDAPPVLLGWDANGHKVLTSDFHGRLVVISFFASWCGPCRKELPILAAIQKSAGRDKLVVVAVNYKEEQEVVRRMRRTFKDYEITFTNDYSGSIGATFGVDGLPHMIILGKDGKIAAKHVGYGEASLTEVVDDINKLWRESQQ